MEQLTERQFKEIFPGDEKHPPVYFAENIHDLLDGRRIQMASSLIGQRNLKGIMWRIFEGTAHTMSRYSLRFFLPFSPQLEVTPNEVNAPVETSIVLINNIQHTPSEDPQGKRILKGLVKYPTRNMRLFDDTGSLEVMPLWSAYFLEDYYPVTSIFHLITDWPVMFSRGFIEDQQKFYRAFNLETWNYYTRRGWNHLVALLVQTDVNPLFQLENRYWLLDIFDQNSKERGRRIHVKGQSIKLPTFAQPVPKLEPA